MKINEYSESNNVEDNDYFLIQKGDATGEYKKLKAENLAINTNSNSVSTADYYYRGSVEPINKQDGFIWDEINPYGNFVQRWINSNNEWVGSNFEVRYSKYSNANETFIHRINKNFNLEIYGYDAEIWNLSGKPYPSGSPPVNCRVRACDINLFEPLQPELLHYVGSRKLNNNQRELVSDLNARKFIPRDHSHKHLVINTYHLDSSWYALINCILYCYYSRAFDT